MKKRTQISRHKIKRLTLDAKRLRENNSKYKSSGRLYKKQSPDPKKRVKVVKPNFSVIKFLAKIMAGISKIYNNICNFFIDRFSWLKKQTLHLLFLIFIAPWIWMDETAQAIGAKIRKAITSTVKNLAQMIKVAFYSAREGQLSYYFLLKLGIKNLIYAKSKSLVTVGAIALGSGAIVFLVSFAFGLQEIVTGRLIFPNATRIADVQSATTALALDTESIKEISQISGVEEVAPAISAAGTLEYNNSKTDVVVISAQNNYLEFSNYHPIQGGLFSEEANQGFAMHQQKIDEMQDILAQVGDVLGAEDVGEDIKQGDFIDQKTVRIRVNDDLYLPVRSAPNLDAQILGYVRGSLLHTYQAQQVWGESFQSSGAEGRAAQASDGTWLGKWVKAVVPLHQEQASTVYVPINKENGEQLTTEGYLPQTDLHILTQDELMIEHQLQKVAEESEGQVLGEATGSADATTATSSSSTSINTSNAIVVIAADSTASATATTSAAAADQELSASELSDLVASQQQEQQQEEALKTSLAYVDVAREGGKEILVSTGLLEVWDINAADVLGKELVLEYILSSGVISGLAGKVKSNPVSYKVVGVIQDSRSIVVTPLGEIASMGSDRFTSLKILSKEEGLMQDIRSHVEALGFTTQSLTDTLMQVNKLFTVMKFLLGLFGMIALVVAIFGMFNTLTISFLERTREIGVMKTLGTTDADVLKMFMIESLLIGVVGGIGGILLGMTGGKTINIVFNLLKPAARVNLFHAPAGFVIFIFVLSVMVGLLTGLYPSNRAKKIKALDALRYE